VNPDDNSAFLRVVNTPRRDGVTSRGHRATPGGTGQPVRGRRGKPCRSREATQRDSLALLRPLIATGTVARGARSRQCATRSPDRLRDRLREQSDKPEASGASRTPANWWFGLGRRHADSRGHSRQLTDLVGRLSLLTSLTGADPGQQVWR
jgi:hypothetical protein